MIDYLVIGNALTTPPSNTCRIAPKQVLGYDKIAELINTHNPTIPAATAKSVIEALREEVLTQLLEGNTVLLENFVSFVSTLPQRLVLPTDPINTDSARIAAKVATPYIDRLRLNAQYNRTGYPVKAPAIIAGWDTNTDTANWITNGSPFKITGQNLGFDKAVEDVGVFIIPATGTEQKQANIASMGPSGIIFVPDFTLVQSYFPDVTIVIKTRYTENGQIRTGSYSNKVRATVESGGLFSLNGSARPVTTLTSSNAIDETLYRFALSIRPSGEVTLALGTMSLMGADVVIPANGVYELSVGSSEDTVTFSATVADYDLLYANALACGRYICEVYRYQAA